MSLFLIIAVGLIISLIALLYTYKSFGSFMGWYGIELPGNRTTITTIYDAVSYKDAPALDRLINEGADVDAPDYRGQAPILLAAATDQFQMVDKLITANANIWAIDKLGYTVGIYASTSHISPTSTEGIARERVIKKLQELGYPWPPPFPDQVLLLKEQENWPPTQPASE